MAHPTGTVLVTGANRGLGFSIASQLLTGPYNCHGLFPVRKPSDESSKALQQLISASPEKSASIIQLDLSSLASVRACAQEVNALVSSGKLPPIRAVILNAGTQHHRGQTFTNDGFEATFAVNYLANYLLVLLILGSMDPEAGRIVMVSSYTYNPAHPLSSPYKMDKLVFQDPDDMAKPKRADPAGDESNAGMRRYGLSKTLLMIMYQLQSRLDSDPKLHNISVLSVDPGAMPQGGIGGDGPISMQIMRYLAYLFLPVLDFFNIAGIVRTAKRSAGDMLFAAFDIETLGERPKALSLDGRKGEDTSEEVKDKTKQATLWESSLKMVGVKARDTVLANWR